MIQPVVIPDATLEPVAYKQALIDLVGDRDPVAVLEATIPAVRRIAEGVGEEALYAEQADGEWPAAWVVGHMFDVDIVYGFRFRLVLTEDNPTYPGYDEKFWTPLPHLPFWPLVSAWEGLRAANLLVLHRTRDQWHRTGVHGEQGPEDFTEMVQKLAAHDLAHLNQFERAVEAVR